jgi:hypothetical protein
MAAPNTLHCPGDTAGYHPVDRTAPTARLIYVTARLYVRLRPNLTDGAPG